MKTAFITAMTVVFALLAGPVQAYYGATMDVTITLAGACPCDIISSDEIHVMITNYGTGSDTYHMSLELPDGWSGFIVPEVTLASGETGEATPVWITPSCGTSPGIYTVTVVAQSGMSGKRFEEAVEINVMACHAVEVYSVNRLDTCESEEVHTTVEISNLGKTDEIFTLSAYPEWAALSADSITVGPGETGTVSLRLTPPAGLTGVQDVTIRAKSRISYAEDERLLKLDVNRCYVFNASLSPADNMVCIGSSADYYLNIDNLGTKADTYRIITPDWITAEQDTVSVDSHGRKTVKITAIPPERGERIVAVSVASTSHTTATIDAESTVTARDCRSVAVSVSPAQRSICRGESTNFIARVENTGTVLTSYAIDSSVGALERKKLVLGPGEAHNVILNIGPTTKAGTSIVTVHAYDGNVSGEDSVTLNVNSCYDAFLEVNPPERSACRGDILTFTVGMKNTGEFEDEYTFEYLGEREDFVLEPGETKTMDVRIPAGYEWSTSNNVRFSLRSTHGVYIEKHVTIGVVGKDKCHSVDLRIVNGTTAKKISTAVGYGMPVQLSIVNNGLRSDRYIIVVDGPEWAHISEDSVYLIPLQEERLYLYLSPPYGTEEKEYKIAVMADSEKALSGVEITAEVLSELPGNVTVNETGNITQVPGGLTGMFLALDDIPIEVLSISLLALGSVIILLMRFVIFK